MFERFKESMKKEFAMSDLGKMKYFLGVKVIQDHHGIFISQKTYAHEVLERFGLLNSNSVKNPIVPGSILSKNKGGAAVDTTMFKQMIGSLMYLTATRADLMYSICLISRYMERSIKLYLQAAKRILRYFKGTVELGIAFKRATRRRIGGVC